MSNSLNIDCITSLTKRVKASPDYNPSFSKIADRDHIKYFDMYMK